MSAQNFIKDPLAVLDYPYDWSQWLLPSGDTLSTSTWTATPGITIGNGSNGAAAPSNTTTSSTVWLAGGSTGQVYTVTNKVTTAQGRTDERSITIRVQQR